MRPEVVEWLSGVVPGPVAGVLAPTWFTCVGLAGVVTLIWMMRAGRRVGVDGGTVASAILWGYLAAVVAGIVVPMLIDTAEHAIEGGVLHVHWAGMTSFWGYIAGAAAVAIVARRGGVSLGRLVDLAAAPLGVALCLARCGCFLAGCDYGKVTALPWAVRFPAGSPAWRDHVAAGLVPPGRAESLPVHPTQLYEAMLGIAIVVVALLIARRTWARARPGRVALVGVVVYSIGRFGIETLRGDAGRGFFGPLSSGQVFSLAVLAAIAGAWLWSRHRRGVALVAAAAIVPMLVAIAPRTASAQPVAGAETAAEAPKGEPLFSVGVLAGWSAPLNRRNGQVPPLAGPSLSIGYHLRGGVSAWLDLDSYGNDEATHGTALVSLQWEKPVRGRWSFAPRFGMGTTLVNFDAPAFRDVSGLTMRAEANFELDLSDRWVLWLRPASLDLLTANDLGGPIFAWQFRVGLAYQHRGAPRRAVAAAPAAPPPSVPAPAAPPPTSPTPTPPPTPTEPPPPDPADPVDPYLATRTEAGR